MRMVADRVADMVHSFEDLDSASREKAFAALTEEERWLLLFEISFSHNKHIDAIGTSQVKLQKCVDNLWAKIATLEEHHERSISRIPPQVWVFLAGTGAVIGGAIGNTQLLPW